MLAIGLSCMSCAHSDFSKKAHLIAFGPASDFFETYDVRSLLPVRRPDSSSPLVALVLDCLILNPLYVTPLSSILAL